MNFRSLVLSFLFAPLPLLAQTADSPFGLEFAMYSAVGFFGALAIVVFVTGFIMYITRLGTERREDGIKVMANGMSILMVVIFATAALYWFEK